MKKTYRILSLFALVAIFGLFACNDNSEEEQEEINDSPFVGAWNLKSYNTTQDIELLDSIGNVYKTLKDQNAVSTDYSNATIEFFKNYTAESIIQEGELYTVNAYQWKDLGNQLVLNSLFTYQDAQLDTMNIARSGNAITLTTTRKSAGNYTEKWDEEYYDIELDSTYEVSKSKTYKSRIYTNITINIDK